MREGQAGRWDGQQSGVPEDCYFGTVAGEDGPTLWRRVRMIALSGHSDECGLGCRSRSGGGAWNHEAGWGA